MVAINCSAIAPYSSQLVTSLNTAGIVIITSCTVCTIAVVAFYIEAAIYLYRRIASKYRRYAILWVLGIYPVNCVFALIGLYVPRSALIVNLTSATYLSIAVYLFLVLILDFYGDDKELAKSIRGTRVPATKLTFCWCCKCLPDIVIKDSTVKKLNVMVYQIAVLRPIVLYCELLAWADRGYVSGVISWDDPYLYLHTATAVSTLVAVYALTVIKEATRGHLQGYRINAKFICLQLSLLFSNIQHLVIALFTSTGVIKCEPPFDFDSRSWWIHNFLQIYEMTIIFFAAHAFYRVEKGNVDSFVKMKYTKDDSFTTMDITLHDSRGLDATIDAIENSFQQQSEIDVVHQVQNHSENGPVVSSQTETDHDIDLSGAISPMSPQWNSELVQRHVYDSSIETISAKISSDA
ncbi:organic solute transporter subunit alpha-like [Glandiceps talaboti]